MEAIIGAITAIALGVSANLVTPLVQKRLKIVDPVPTSVPEYDTTPSDHTDSGELEAWREANRRKRNLFFAQVYAYGFSFFSIYAAVFLSLSWSAGISNDALNFTNTKLGFDFILYREYFSTASALIAIALYMPSLIAARKIANAIYHVAFRYGPIGRIRYLSFVALGMVFMALIIAGHAIFLLNEMRGYVESVVLPFLVMFMVAGFASSRR